MLTEPENGDAAEQALDAIAALCGCKTWEYPGQVVRDVEAVVRQLHSCMEELSSAEKGAAQWKRECDTLRANYNAVQADLEREYAGNQKLRKRYGAQENETMFMFIERLYNAAHGGTQKSAVSSTLSPSEAFIPGIGTVRVCRACGCLVAGGPTACRRCVAMEVAKPG